VLGLSKKGVQSAIAYLKLPLSKSGLRLVLIDIFFHRQASIDSKLLRKSVLVQTLAKYKDSAGVTFQKLVFKREAPSTAENEVRGLILKLFATGVFAPEIDGDKLYCDLARDDTANPVINTDAAFIGKSISRVINNSY
jgi:hypothetical protein